MLTAFARAFRTPDLRTKLLFTLGIVVLYRVGSVVPSPGVSTTAVDACLSAGHAGANNNVYSLINLFSGGALLQLSIFALGIMPYITASIIIQLLVVVIPRLEQLKKEGSSGEQKLTQYTRYLTIALGVLQATGIVALARSGRLFPDCSIPIIPDTSLFRIATIVITMTAGTAMIMWLGELITARGVGNGMSLLIFVSIASSLPSQGGRILQVAGGVVFTLVCLLGLAIVVFVVFVEQSQRRIPVQYAKRLVGRKMYGGTSTYLPIKVNQAGIIPVIFASSLLQLPQLIGQVWNNQTFNDFQQRFLARGDHPLYLAIYAGLIIFFTYFYVAITFNPTEVADNMKKYGGLHPGHQTRSSHGGVPRPRLVAHHVARVAVSRCHYSGAVGAAEPDQGPALPVRGHLRSDHGGGGAGNRETDREPAHAPQLRRFPPVVRLVLVGPPGAGKGTQAAFIAQARTIPKISTGDIFRANVREGTELGVAAKKYMDAGDLVPDEVTIGMVRNRLAEDDAVKGFLLDGFPRNVPQAEVLGQMLDAMGTKLDVVLELVVDDDEVVRRLSGRRTCRNCGHIWHVDFDPPGAEGICDRCGGELFQRDDDKPETIRHRLEVYAEQTSPLVAYYAAKGLLIGIDATGPVDNVTDRALDALRHFGN